MCATTYPNKVFDYMAAGRPTVLAITGVIRDCLEAAGGGIAVPPGDAQALAEAVLKYYQNPELRRQHGESARSYVARYFNRQEHACQLAQLLVLQQQAGLRRRQLRTKRLGDLLIAIPLTVLLLPVMLLIAALVRLKLGSPIIFSQVRAGHQGKLFTLWKFRTMTDERDATGRPLPDEQRLTGVGRFLRSTSLDELPTLFNVIKGDMSLIGPRPLLPEYLTRYTPVQARRHEVKPGITGWAQVNGRNALSWEEKLALDVEYVERLSLALDLRILLMTVLTVLKKKGISAPGHATAPVFEGKQ